jgi:MPBQ/MSBQ methyltransferase
VSAGSIEYWPDPLRGIAEAYRVTRPGGVALVIGPVRPAHPFARWLAETWMLFPAVGEYTGWMEQAGFTDVRVRELAPDWYRDTRTPYAIAVSGVKRTPGASPAAGRVRADEPVSRLRFAARFVAGSAAGALFVPIAAVLSLRRRRA